MPILNLLLSLGKKKTYCYLVSPTIGAPLLVLLPSDLWRVVPVDHHTHHAQNIPTYGLLYTEGQSIWHSSKNGLTIIHKTKLDLKVSVGTQCEFIYCYCNSLPMYFNSSWDKAQIGHYGFIRISYWTLRFEMDQIRHYGFIYISYWSLSFIIHSFWTLTYIR
ncbi:unnamed protein product [Cuscuta epithymum]|uniref:Uncharacterized protein n=1 Tax=Cuscuta epithymum TaxID=186058 RepID=A0AAV0E1G4_9ASTE|nr:unnamed protein product [Cuscuta epithymum]